MTTDIVPVWRITFLAHVLAIACPPDGATFVWQHVQGTEPTPDEIARYKAMTGFDRHNCQVTIEQVTAHVP